MRHLCAMLSAQWRRLRDATGPSEASLFERQFVRRYGGVFDYLWVNGLQEGRDILALAASHGRHRADTIVDAVVEAPSSLSGRMFRWSYDLEPLLQLAVLLADQPRRPSDSRDAVRLLRSLAQRVGMRSIRKDNRFRVLELLVDAGEVLDLEGLLQEFHIGRDDSNQPHLLRANASNPFRGDGGKGSTGAWMSAMDALFAADGLERIEVVSGEKAPFDRLTAATADPVQDGPLVTVVVPTYEPGERISTALESLLAQSYRSLQILIMDDASSPSCAVEIDRWRDRDPRIEVVHLESNSGPYLARNVAVSTYARGSYITTHDDDDWSHPRKIERQVAQLEAEQSIPANMSNAVRASDDLWFGRINGNPVWTQHALSSLMVRRAVFDEIGYWDVLNRSADAEFNDRIRAWTGAPIPVVGRAPLAFYRVRWDSLSAGEFSRGYMDARRRWYYQSYSQWHRHEIAEGRVPRLPVDDRAERPFSVPVDLRVSRHGGNREVEVDLLIVADFRLGDQMLAELREEVEVALAEGSRVALLQLDSPLASPAAKVHPGVLELARHRNAAVVALADRVTAQIGVICHPEAFAFRSAESSLVRTHRLVLLARTTDAKGAGGGVTAGGAGEVMSRIFNCTEPILQARTVRPFSAPGGRA